jgi:Domain of unknown function (DUF5658)
MAETTRDRVSGALARGASLAPTVPAVALLLLNVLDGLFTLTYLELGVAEEANPLMRVAYELSPLGFMGFKLVVVNLGVWVLATHQQSRLARAALNLAVFAYSVIVTWHLAFLAWLLLH